MRSELITFIAVFFTVFLLGCVSPQQPIPTTPSVSSFTQGIAFHQINLRFDPSFNHDDREMIKRTIEYKLVAFKEYFGREARPVVMYVYNQSAIKRGKDRLFGWANIQQVHVIAGTKRELPALFHELCHANEVSGKYGLDPNHSDEEWRVWESVDDYWNTKIRRLRS